MNLEINEIRKRKEENRKLKNNYNLNGCDYATIRSSDKIMKKLNSDITKENR